MSLARLGRDYALSIVMAVMFVVAWAGAAIAGWFEFASEQQAHGQTPQLFGDDGYVWTFAEQTLQNWQSEFLAVLALVVLASFLIHRGSQQSRDSKDELRTRIETVSKRVDAVIAAAKEG